METERMTHHIQDMSHNVCCIIANLTGLLLMCHGSWQLPSSVGRQSVSLSASSGRWVAPLVPCFQCFPELGLGTSKRLQINLRGLKRRKYIVFLHKSDLFFSDISLIFAFFLWNMGYFHLFKPLTIIQMKQSWHIKKGKSLFVDTAHN